MANGNLPSFGREKTLEELRKSFGDWAKYAPITFKEVSQYEKADINLAFGEEPGRSSGKFGTQGDVLAYARLPEDGTVRFDPAELWTLR